MKLLVAGAWLRGLWRLTVLDATFVAQFAAFSGLALAFRRLAVLVRFFLDETGGFLGVTLDAHCFLLNGMSRTYKRWAPRLFLAPADHGRGRGLPALGLGVCGLQRPDFGNPNGK